MENHEKIEQKFQKLLSEGKEIFSQGGWNGKEWNSSPSSVDYLRFRTESLNLISRVCGENSAHYKELKNIAEDKQMNSNSYFFHMCYGILEAAHNDFTEGFLFDLRALINAELLGDFIEQAETLLKEGYYVPAASLAGATLEDSLRKLCEKNKIVVPEKTSLDKLNIELARASVYSKLIQKEITAKADIRNNADHGNYDKFSKEDVKSMIDWIRRFESEYLG